MTNPSIEIFAFALSPRDHEQFYYSYDKNDRGVSMTYLQFLTPLVTLKWSNGKKFDATHERRIKPFRSSADSNKKKLVGFF